MLTCFSLLVQHVMAMVCFLECVRYSFSCPAYRLGLRLVKRYKPVQLMRSSVRFRVSFHVHLNSLMKHAFWQVCSPGENMSASFSESLLCFHCTTDRRHFSSNTPKAALLHFEYALTIAEVQDATFTLCPDPMRYSLII